MGVIFTIVHAIRQQNEVYIGILAAVNKTRFLQKLQGYNQHFSCIDDPIFISCTINYESLCHEYIYHWLRLVFFEFSLATHNLQACSIIQNRLPPYFPLHSHNVDSSIAVVGTVQFTATSSWNTPQKQSLSQITYTEGESIPCRWCNLLLYHIYSQPLNLKQWWMT